MATKFSRFVDNLFGLQHCLQNPNTTFQYRDMSHQMTWYILAHMPYFAGPVTYAGIIFQIIGRKRIRNNFKIIG